MLRWNYKILKYIGGILPTFACHFQKCMQISTIFNRSLAPPCREPTFATRYAVATPELYDPIDIIMCNVFTFSHFKRLKYFFFFKLCRTLWIIPVSWVTNIEKSHTQTARPELPVGQTNVCTLRGSNPRHAAQQSNAQPLHQSCRL